MSAVLLKRKRKLILSMVFSCNLKVLEILHLHKFLEKKCSLFLKCCVCISDLWYPSLLKMGNVDKEDREMIPSIHLVFTLKDMKDSLGVQFSTGGLEHILIYGRGMCM